METAICTIQNITKRHGASNVLGPLSLVLYPGEILGIRGANGAGKSTLIKIIAGVSKADSGSVNIASAVKKNIGYVPQDVALYPSLSGKHNLEFWAGINGLRGKQKDIRINWLLKEVNLQDKAKVPVEEYSGGMRRRLNLAAALLATPAILLLDEPTVGADNQSVEIMLSLMERMRAQGVAVLFISHQGEELRQVCNRIITMEEGLITQEDDVM